MRSKTKKRGAGVGERAILSQWHGGDRKSERTRVGLCADCQYVRRVKSARGSTFYFCERSAGDPNFPKYPRLPVIQCSGYEPKREGGH